jgi:hypothetical protein
LPVIEEVFVTFAAWTAASSSFCFTAVSSSSSEAAPWKTSFRMEVPIRIRSPSFSRACLIFSPLTKVPFVDPRSSMVIFPFVTVIFAC